MTQKLPTKCIDCVCIEKDAEGKPIKFTEMGHETYHCKRNSEEKSIVTTVAETQAICLESEKGEPIPTPVNEVVWQ